MTVRPGRNLIWATLLTAAAAFGVFLWIPLAGVLVLVLLLLLIAAVRDYQLAKAALAQIVVTRELPTMIGRNLPFNVTLTLTNNHNRTVRGRVRDVTPAIGEPDLLMHDFVIDAARTATFVDEYRIPRRGSHAFGPVWVRVTGPWGLVDGQRASDCHGTIKVLPETFASRDELIKDLGADVRLLDKITLTRQHGAGTEFESLQSYRYGDDPRRIDWRTTARVRFPVVRRYQVERHRDVMIVIDCGRLMGAETDRGSKLDCAVDAGLNLARVALQSGDRCGIGMFDDRVRGFLPPVSGVGSIRPLSECVYDLQTQWRESDFTRMFAELQFRQKKRSFIIVISDMSDVETSRQFRASLVQLGTRHLVLFAALRTPLLNRIIHEEMTAFMDGARKAVTFRLLRERQQSLHTLRRSGIHIIDVEPQQLTLPLINQFIELRGQNLL